MQEMCEDFYEEKDEGCCLLCSDAHEGCLCFDCKCTQCFWYKTNGYKGWCEKTDDLREKGKAKAREFYKRLDKKKVKAYKKWYKRNFRNKINNEKITIKPKEFLNGEIKKENLRRERVNRKKEWEIIKKW